MNLQQMIDGINRRIDDVIDIKDATDWLNEGQNILATAVGAKFPQLVDTVLTGTFVFDEKYHTIPVTFACARYKEYDSSLNEAYNFMNQFENMKKDFVKNYVVPPRYRDDRLSQQFTATAGQQTFVITKQNYDPAFGDLKVYVNDQDTDLFIINDDKSFTLTEPCNDGDAVTAVWEEHAEMTEPPYKWWSW